MEAYDPKELVNGFKEEGLEIAEDVAVKIARRTVKWLDQSAQASQTPIDDVLRVLYPKLETELVKLADKIDGKQDQPVQA